MTMFDDNVLMIMALMMIDDDVLKMMMVLTKIVEVEGMVVGGPMSATSLWWADTNFNLLPMADTVASLHHHDLHSTPTS